MKKTILSLILLLVVVFTFGQDIKERSTLITSATLKAGGDFIIVPQTLGKVTKILTVDIFYEFKSTAYTVASGTDVTIKSLTGDNLVESIAPISDELFEKTVKYLSYTNQINTNLAYSNPVILSIPSSKFTGGDSDIKIVITYILVD